MSTSCIHFGSRAPVVYYYLIINFIINNDIINSASAHMRACEKFSTKKQGFAHDKVKPSVCVAVFPQHHDHFRDLTKMVSC